MQSISSRPTSRPCKELVKVILRFRIDKENNYVTSNNMRFAKREPIKDSSLSTSMPSSVSNLYFFQKAAILDAKVGESKKTFERKKYSQLIHMLKEFIEVTIMTKRILNLKVSLTISETLVLDVESSLQILLLRTRLWNFGSILQSQFLLTLKTLIDGIL